MIKSLLGLFVKDVVENAQRDILRREAQNQLIEASRQEILRHVAEGFSREINHNLSQYVRSVGQITAEISTEHNEGEQLFFALQSALSRLEVELEELGPDSAVVQYLTRRYGGPDTSSLVGRQPQPVWSTVPGSQTTPDTSRPWLNRAVEVPTNLFSVEAASVLERLLSRSTSPLSSDFRSPQEPEV